MASGKLATLDTGGLATTGELERVQECLKEVTKKNHALEEMLLYTAQELEKEKENSRRIVQTLTERLMESREMINQLEYENMRYKKDCLLAVELLQCNRIADKDQVSTTVKRLSGHTDPVTYHSYGTGINPFAIDEREVRNTTNVSAKTPKDEITNFQPSRPRAPDTKKNKTEAANVNYEDTTSLLDKEEQAETDVKISSQGNSSAREDKIPKEDNKVVGHHKDSSKDQFQKPPKNDWEGSPSTTDNRKQKLLYNPQNVADAEMKASSFPNKDIYLKERESFTDLCQREGEPLIGNDNSKSTASQVDTNIVDSGGLNKEDSCLKCENECLNDESLYELDKPYISVSESGSLPQENFNSPEENIKFRGENAHTVKVRNTAEIINTVDKGTGDVIGKSIGVISTAQTTRAENGDIPPQVQVIQDEDANNEDDKLLDAERNEDAIQQLSSVNNTRASKLVILEEDNDITTDENERIAASVGNDERSLMDDDATLKGSETELNYDGEATKLGEADEEITTAEENTPLV